MRYKPCFIDNVQLLDKSIRRWRRYAFEIIRYVDLYPEIWLRQMLGLIILDELNPLLRLVIHFGHLSNSPFLKKVCLLPLQGQHLTKYQVVQNSFKGCGCAARLRWSRRLRAQAQLT